MNRTKLSLFTAVFVVSLFTMSAISAGNAGNPNEAPKARANAFASPAPLGTTTTAAPTTTTVAPLPPEDGPEISFELPAENLDDPDLPALPVPAPAPTENYFDEPIIDLGRIEIPKIGLDVSLGQGISLDNIDRGPSHWPGAALPGEMGNAVIAGHRVTKGGPFRYINELIDGDQVIFTVDNVRSVYEVFDTEIVTPDGLHILEQTREHTATLFACHPPGSTKYRYVVKLRMVESNIISVYVDHP